MMNEILAPQGWQCPICKRVYSPNTYMCYYCGGESVATTGTGIAITGTGVDYRKYQPNINISKADMRGKKNE